MIKMPVGISDFGELIRDGYYFVDKTALIGRLIDSHAKVTLFTRPRRFGKTLTLSMMDYFFNISHKEEAASLFKGTKIASSGGTYLSFMGTRPVIFLSLKDVTEKDYSHWISRFGRLMAVLYLHHHFLLDDPLPEAEKNYFLRIEHEESSPVDLQDSLATLLRLLSRHAGLPVLLLLDEYDAPIQSAWDNGYYDQAISFMRNFLSSALKDNPSLDFALITGVLRVAKESIFSGLNNLAVSSVISGGYADCFGFTAEEVREIGKVLGQEDKLSEIADWYDGYDFQNVEIYNPWSVINYFRNNCLPSAYWVSTSGNSILHLLLSDVDEIRSDELTGLLSGRPVTVMIHESITYSDIGENTDDLYTILLFTGYLKCVGRKEENGLTFYELAIPNQEIRSIYRDEILARMTGKAGGSMMKRMMDAMLQGKTELFAASLQKILLGTVSFHDAAKPESFYHGFMLGMTLWLEKSFLLRSNRESGYGRFDLALIPKEKNLPAVLMEFKAVKEENEMTGAAEKAKHQISEKAYPEEIKAAGIQTLWTYGIAFCGKKVIVK